MNTCPFEDDEAVAFADWLRARRFAFAHVANESRSNSRSAMIRGAKLKRMGQSRGVYDYEIFVPTKSGKLKEIRVELKRQKGGSVSPEQKVWGEVYTKAGIPNRVCKGAEAAIDFVKEIECSEER